MLMILSLASCSLYQLLLIVVAEVTIPLPPPISK